MATGYSSLRNAKVGRPKPPDDFKDEAEFLAHMRKEYDADIQFDKDNRDAAAEDLQFFIGDQWDDQAKERRERRQKPVISVNRLPAFAGQLIGNRRMNEAQIKVLPDNDGNKEVAAIRTGLIRNIQKVSDAKRVYDKAYENELICGIGNFSVGLEYAADDVFEQDIRIRTINDALAVVWDRRITDPTGADARHVYVVDTIDDASYKEQWPWADKSDFDSLGQSDNMAGWFENSDIRIVNYWRMRTEKRTLAMLQNGNVLDVTDKDEAEWAPFVMIHPETQAPIVREADRSFAELYICSGTNILEGPYRLPIKRVPVFRVPGWEVHVGEKRHRWGLVRFMKDPMRLHNYWRSVIAERLAQSPKAKWVATTQAVQGREAEWRNSHLSDDPLLTYDGETGAPPTMVPPAPLEAALINEAITTTQDMRDVSNIHEAALGQTSNEVSGKGIVARQRVSELGTVLYSDNLNEAIAECGKVINDLLAITYDTPRTVRILGDDDEAVLQRINDPEDTSALDIVAGKYSVTITTGPSYLTKRIEAAESMMQFLNTVPQKAAEVMDLIAEAQDWPKAQEFARRFRLGLPPGMLDPKDMSPEQQQAQKAAAEKAQEQEQLATATQMATADKIDSEAEESKANAVLAKANAYKAVMDAESRMSDVDSKDRERKFKAGLAAVETAFPKHRSGDKTDGK